MEAGGTRPDVAKLHWADGSTPNPTTAPNESKKDDGFVHEDVPPAEEENWWRKFTGEIANWLDATHVREFSTLSEGIAAVAAPRRFVVHPPTGGISTRLSEQYNKEGEGGAVAVVTVRTDGQRIYYAQGTYVYAASPEDSDDIDWSQVGSGTAIIDLWADGRWVYVLRAYSAGYDEIWLLDPTDGSEDQHLALISPSGTLIRANGEYMCVARGNNLHVWDDVGGTPSSVGTFDHTDDIRACAIGNQRIAATPYTEAFLGGDRGTDSKDVRCIRLDTVVEVWSVTLPVGAGAVVHSLVCDDEYAYAGIQSGGGAENTIHCLSKFDGTVIWSAYGSGATCNAVVVDDRYLYATSSAKDLYVYDKRTGVLLWKIDHSDIAITDCDGLSIFGTNTVNNCLRWWRGNLSQMFQRTVETDQNRNPFHKLAVPMPIGR